MKLRSYALMTFAFLGLGITSLQAQEDADSTGLPGDNFSLEGALSLFSKATSPEEFERSLNTEDNHVNNLDLNGDGEIDYIKVIDKMEGDVHVFILQVVVSESENQDIATIQLEKTSPENAIIQITGDEDIYGEETTIEPADDGGSAFNDSQAQPRIHGPAEPSEISAVIVNVWFWPTVRFVYAPVYVAWRSPWHYRNYPVWWRPWHPVRWNYYRPLVRPYRARFVRVNTYRVVRARTIYAPVRSSSVSVRTRNQTSINHYRVTHTKTTVTGRKGQSVTRRSTTVEGRKVQRKSTKLRKKR